MGIPMQVTALMDDGRAICRNREGKPYESPVQTLLLDQTPDVGDWVLTHIDTAIRTLAAEEADLIGDALEALECAARGQAFEHLLGDLIDREPELPAHLRDGDSHLET